MYIRILVLFLFIVPALSFSKMLDVKKCSYVESPQIVKVECDENCLSHICLGKIECDLGNGPVIMDVSCQLPEGEFRCPDAVRCIYDKKVKFSSPKKYRKSGNVSEDNVGGSNAQGE